MNIIAIFHSYKFTHYSYTAAPKTKADRLSGFAKLKIAVSGIDNPKPVNTREPLQPYKTIVLTSNKKIECWSVKAKKANGTVVLFHGYGRCKSEMLDKSNEFLKLGYNTLLVDFMGSGGSEDDQTTIGYYEALEVKTCYDYLKSQGEKNIYLFGTSMGSVAILKAINDYKIEPNAIITECPFGSMYKTVCARFKIVGAPTFPLAGMLVFWGGAINGYWAFGLNPEAYAKKVTCPALLLYGEKDNRVSRNEINIIYANLKGKKRLSTYPLAGHDNYLDSYKDRWIADMKEFLDANAK